MSHQIAVIGAGTASADLEAVARDLGRALAEKGCTIICGGLGGVMAAVCEGVKQAGGLSIGIVPGESRLEANPDVSVVVATGIGHARNLAVVASGDAVVAVGGSWGTASEVALARKLGRPVVVLGEGLPIDGDGVIKVSSVEEAVSVLFAISLQG